MMSEIGDLSWGFTMKTFFRLIRWLMGDFMGISRDVDNLYMMVSSYLYLRS